MKGIEEYLITVNYLSSFCTPCTKEQRKGLSVRWTANGVNFYVKNNVGRMSRGIFERTTNVVINKAMELHVSESLRYVKNRKEKELLPLDELPLFSGGAS